MGTTKRPIVAFVAAHFSTDLPQVVHIALLPLFMTVFNLSLLEIGLVVMVPRLCGAMITIPSGMLVERIGYVKQIVFSLLVTSVAGLLAAFSPNIFVLVFALSLLEIARMFYHPSAFSAVSQIGSRGASLGFHMVGGTAGLSLGPISAGILLKIVEWRFVYLICSIPPLLCIPSIMKLKFFGCEENPGEKKMVSIQKGIHNIRSSLTTSFLILLVVTSLEMLGREIVSTFMSPYLVLSRNISVSDTSILVGLISVAGIFGAPSGGILADKFGEKRLYSASIIGVSISLLGIAYIHPIGLIFFLLLFGYFRHSGRTSSASLVADLEPSNIRGVAYAFYFLLTYIAIAMASVVGGYVAENFGVSQIFPVAIGIIFISLIILQLIQRSNTN